MTESSKQSVHLNFRHTENEYLAATRLYFWQSKELLGRLIVTYVFVSAALLLLPIVMGFSLPLWVNLALMFITGLAWFHGYVVDIPRRYFRGDPKFRDEYHLTFSDAGVEFQTQSMSSMIAWSYYTSVIENDSFYLLIYGKNINTVSIVPKRAFQDSQQETTFRQILRRNLDHTLILSAGERESPEYVPKRLEPPDWR